MFSMHASHWFEHEMTADVWSFEVSACALTQLGEVAPLVDTTVVIPTFRVIPQNAYLPLMELTIEEFELVVAPWPGDADAGELTAENPRKTAHRLGR